jgi:hypothetical protein
VIQVCCEDIAILDTQLLARLVGLLKLAPNPIGLGHILVRFPTFKSECMRSAKLPGAHWRGTC